MSLDITFLAKSKKKLSTLNDKVLVLSIYIHQQNTYSGNTVRNRPFQVINIRVGTLIINTNTTIECMTTIIECQYRENNDIEAFLVILNYYK